MINLDFLNGLTAGLENLFSLGVDLPGIISSILGGLGGFGSS